MRAAKIQRLGGNATVLKFEPLMVQYTVGIRNLEVKSPVGVYAEERALQVKLIVTATLTFPETDHLPVSLQASFDYARLTELVIDACRQPHNLLEQLAQSIVNRLLPIIDKPCHLQLRIEKRNPVLNRTMDSAFVEVMEQLTPGKSRR